MKQIYTVGGMSCAACAAGIERTVKRLQGVRFCAVSLMGESMEVEYDESVLTSAEIVSAVTKLGYQAYEAGKQPQKNAKRLPLLVRFLISAVLLVPLMVFSMGGMFGLPVPEGWWNHGFQLGLTTVILAVNCEFFISGVRAAIKRVPNMDTLITLGAAASYFYSVAVLIQMHTGGAGTGHTGMGNLFFESAAMIVTLVTLGKFLEDKSKKRTGREIEKLKALAPDTVTVVRGGKEVFVPLSEVDIGDLVVVKQGESVPVDGVIEEGHVFLDASAITGESLPVEHVAGEHVSSATIVSSGYMKLRAEKVGEDTMLAGIIRMVREAGTSKAPIQKLADKISAVFVPAVLALAVFTFVIWIACTRDVARSFNFAVSVVVISCPCALGLATPVAIMAATGRGASLGILYKNAEALQKMATVSEVFLDKTATLTEGKPKVVWFDGDAEAKKIAFAIEKKLNHPLAECIVDYCGEGYEAEDVAYIPRQGAVGTVGGKTYFLGNETLMQTKGVKFEAQLERFLALTSEGKTVLFLSDGARVLAMFGLADTLKPGSRAAVEELRSLGCVPIMLTGDNAAVAKVIAREAGFPDWDACVCAELLPEEKLGYVRRTREQHEQAKRELRTARRADSFVAMVGDGINDAPALKEADIGVAIGNGTDVAIESADMVLVKGDLGALPKAVRLAKKTMRVIKQNLFWAFFYNCVGIPLAAGAFAWAGLTLNPMIAAAAMSLSSLFVVTNALRLTRGKTKKEGTMSEIPPSDTPQTPPIGQESGQEEPLPAGNPAGSISEGETAEQATKNLQKGVETMRITLQIKGMMCAHCVKHVTEALLGVAGVERAEVSLEHGTAVVDGLRLDPNALTAAVTEAGYEAVLL